MQTAAIVPVLAAVLRYIIAVGSECWENNGRNGAQVICYASAPAAPPGFAVCCDARLSGLHCFAAAEACMARYPRIIKKGGRPSAAKSGGDESGERAAFTGAFGIPAAAVRPAGKRKPAAAGRTSILSGGGSKLRFAGGRPLGRRIKNARCAGRAELFGQIGLNELPGGRKADKI